MGKKILLLGNTGKMGTAISGVFGGGYEIVGKNSSHINALDFDAVKKLVNAEKPDIVINAIAYLGIDPSEKEPDLAYRLNCLYPKLLAELSKEKGFLLVHFSTDAVFNDEKGGFYTESDCARPLNNYGVTKYGGDCFIQSIAERYYIFRVSVLFGETEKKTQFVEKMIDKVKAGQSELSIADDIISSPTYSKDVAGEIKRIIEADMPFGLYHISNEGSGTLYELMNEVVKNLGLNVKVHKASFGDFPYVGRKNTNTPLKSVKVPPMRPWHDAVREYSKNLGGK